MDFVSMKTADVETKAKCDVPAVEVSYIYSDYVLTPTGLQYQFDFCTRHTQLTRYGVYSFPLAL
eukprot:scaffold20610_cov20-Tisochrysis_lutea.AAC.6